MDSHWLAISLDQIVTFNNLKQISHTHLWKFMQQLHIADKVPEFIYVSLKISGAGSDQ